MIEFFWTPANSRLMVHDLSTDSIEAFTSENQTLASTIDNKVREIYPDAHASLCKIYGESVMMTWARAHRFLKCNFSFHDNTPDLDQDFNFALEMVPCPLRGECKDGICNPKITSVLSNREKDVVRLHVEGLSPAEIGERLFISKSTAHNHFTNIYNKLGFTGHPNPGNQLITYAYKNYLV